MNSSHIYIDEKLNLSEKEKKETPFYIYATAGIRLLSEISQKKVLDKANEKSLKYNYLVKRDHSE